MPVSDVFIGNLALAHIGAKSNIESLTENSPEARAIDLFYEHSLESTLEMYDWSFARKRVALAVDSEDPPQNEWAYRYVYPADCVAAREIEHPRYLVRSFYRDVPRYSDRGDAIPFHIELDSTGSRRTILTDLENATLIYTFLVTDETLFPRTFVDALSWVLASNIAYKITGKYNVSEAMMAKALFVVSQAAAKDMNESVDQRPREAPWIRGRN